MKYSSQGWHTETQWMSYVSLINDILKLWWYMFCISKHVYLIFNRFSFLKENLKFPKTYKSRFHSINIGFRTKVVWKYIINIIVDYLKIIY